MTLVAARQFKCEGITYRPGDVVDPEPVGRLRFLLIDQRYVDERGETTTVTTPTRATAGGHPCPQCGKTFTTARGMRGHVKHQHPTPEE